MKDRALKIILPFVFLIFIFGSWELLSAFEVINSALFPRPSEIFFEVFSESALVYHMLNSVYRLFVSVFIGFSAGVILGLVIGKFKLNFIEDVVTFFMSIPGISWAPLFILIMGFGNPTIITVGSMTAFFPVLYYVVHGLKEVDKNLLRVGDLLEFSVFWEFVAIKIPSLTNHLTISLKLAFVRSWRTIIAIEMIAATTYGLGYMIFDARELLNTETMFMGIILSGIVFYLIEKLVVENIERATSIRWGMKNEG